MSDTNHAVKPNKNTPDQESYWRTITNEWKHSDQPQKIFCKARGVSYAQFVMWRSKFLKAEGKSRTCFSPAKLALPTKPNHNAFQLSLPSGARLHIPGGFNRTDVKNLFELLGVL